LKNSSRFPHTIRTGWALKLSTFEREFRGDKTPKNQKEDTVTLRHRDSMQQERLPISELKNWLLDKIS